MYALQKNTVAIVTAYSWLQQPPSNCPTLYTYIYNLAGIEEAFNNVNKQGIAAIPCLIDSIDENKKELIVGFLNPQSSYIPPYYMDNYTGIQAAYLIELWLAKPSIAPVTYSTWQQQVGPYKLYRDCIIVRMQSNKPFLQPLTLNDMKAIKSIYLKWWQANKDTPVETLRKQYQQGFRILNGSQYGWI